MVYIYILVDPRTGKTRYVGKTKDCNKRYQHHLVTSVNPKSHKRNWIESLKKEGKKPSLYIIDEVPDDEWQYWERYWISQFKTWGFSLVNHTDGGDGLNNGNQTSFKKGFVPWNKHNKGYTTSKRGYRVPEDVKQKISKTLQGNSCKPKRQVKQLDMKGNLINVHNSITEAAKDTGILYSSIANALTGRSKSAGGYIWQ